MKAWQFGSKLSSSQPYNRQNLVFFFFSSIGLACNWKVLNKTKFIEVLPMWVYISYYILFLPHFHSTKNKLAWCNIVLVEVVVMAMVGVDV